MVTVEDSIKCLNVEMRTRSYTKADIDQKFTDSKPTTTIEVEIV